MKNDLKRRIFIIIFGTVFMLGVIYSFNREPSVNVGKVIVAYDEKETEIQGEEIAVYRNSKLKSAKVIEKDFATLKDEITFFEQPVIRNITSNSIQMATDISINYYGRVYSAFYTIYDFNGNVIDDNLENLTLPTKDISGCIVKADVKWGRENNYREYEYYFRVNYIS